MRCWEEALWQYYKAKGPEENFNIELHSGGCGRDGGGRITPGFLVGRRKLMSRKIKTYFESLLDEEA